MLFDAITNESILHVKSIPMKFDLFRAGQIMPQTTTYKNVNVTFDGKTYKMRSVAISDVKREGKTLVGFWWDDMDFVDSVTSKNSEPTNITVHLAGRNIKMKGAERYGSGMNHILYKVWLGQ